MQANEVARLDSRALHNFEKEIRAEGKLLFKRQKLSCEADEAAEMREGRQRILLESSTEVQETDCSQGSCTVQQSSGSETTSEDGSHGSDSSDSSGVPADFNDAAMSSGLLSAAMPDSSDSSDSSSSSDSSISSDSSDSYDSSDSSDSSDSETDSSDSSDSSDTETGTEARDSAFWRGQAMHYETRMREQIDINLKREVDLYYKEFETEEHLQRAKRILEETVQDSLRPRRCDWLIEFPYTNRALPTRDSAPILQGSLHGRCHSQLKNGPIDLCTLVSCPLQPASR